jgi:glyoxalase/bleomycin resistance protein/dioxygenase superfamily protein
MINGAHFLLYSKDPETDRAFMRDVLEFRSVDAGRGWLIFALPPAEIAVHPASENSGIPNVEDGVVGAALYMMCDDLSATMKQLQSKKVKFSAVEEAQWGTVTTFPLPSGAKVGLYQPKHPTALKLSR